MSTPAIPQRILYVIVLAQFCGTSVWFAGNAVLPQLSALNAWPDTAVAYITSATQLGFIVGTLVFALMGTADKYSPSKIFLLSSIAASLLNALMLMDVSSYVLIIISRLFVGIALAGIYPIGMKIAADWNEKGLGHWLGALVGALVVGTAFPHGLNLLPGLPTADTLILIVSLVCLSGGILLKVFVPDGPYRKQSSDFSFASVSKAFSSKNFRAPAFGYFGHMWELYAMWAFIPSIFLYYNEVNAATLNISALSFITIAAGAFGCYFGGLLASRVGSASLAMYALACSAACCLLSVIAWSLPPIAFASFMLFWGVAMAADSPQLSALVAQNTPAEVRGSAITMIMCIGFAITIVSIHLISFLTNYISFKFIFLVLMPGPLLASIDMMRNIVKPKLAKTL